MQQHEQGQFAGLLTDVMAYYGKDVSKFLLDVWWDACKSFEMEQISKALQRHACDPERGQFAPKVADIARVLSGTSTDRAAIAWGKVHEAMSAVGAYTDVVFDDPAIHAVIEDLGGWPKVCRMDLKELSYLQHRFQESHRAYTGRGEFEYQRRLAGDRDPDHEYTSRGLPLPRPALIGNRERAIAVLKNGNVAGKTLITTLPDQAVRLLERPTGGAQ
ncbi:MULTISPECIES: DUF6475 domain-containing protein [Delftia]|uniref:DUF6475 domain-containing protein n=1 Tax=Delftia TaxID=80865 RepID=UPI0006407799|nr:MULTISPECIES: DUF6475 domain-containing protein [Delftia]MCX7509442.1 DUF6475 domain-containing protein [Delftia tsuruhatensis]